MYLSRRIGVSWLVLLCCVLDGLATAAHAADSWQPVPLVSQTLRAAGRAGGEGCQVITCFAAAPNGNTLLMGTDVGGLWRSVDRGATWTPSNRGFKPRGATWMAYDPGDAAMVLVCASNSSAWDWHGLWRSADGGVTWTAVLPLNHGREDNGKALIAWEKPRFWRSHAASRVVQHAQ